MATARRSSELRQVELVDAALRIIATRGIAALTTRGLADEVGLTTGAIFRHFATLDDLLEAVVGRVEGILDATYPAPALPPLDRLALFIDARSRAVGGQLGIMRLVISEQFLLALPARGSERLAACVGRSRAFVTDCLRDAQRSGAVRTDLSPEVLAPIVMGTLQMIAVSRATTHPRGPDARTLRDALLLVLGPVPTVAKPGRKRPTP